MLTFFHYIWDRRREITSKVGAICLAMTGAAQYLGTVESPWNIILYAAGVGAILFKEQVP